MDKVSYLSNSTTAQNGVYPVTIQGLDFIQSQILTLQNLAFNGGDNYVIKEPTADPVQNGIMVWAGEVLPLSGAAANYVQIVSAKKSITTDNGVYTDARETRIAQYITKPLNTPETDTLKLRSRFAAIMTNAAIWAQVEALMNAAKVETVVVLRGVYPLAALDKVITPARVLCYTGSANIGGYNAYTVDAFNCNGVIYQELKTADLRRFGRYFTAGKWSDFVPLDDQCHIEAKVIRGTLYLRHGFLPPYARIIVLRKKRRDKHAGKGRNYRSVKCAWYHGWKMELAKGQPNTWYVPKCIAADKPFRQHIGKEFAPLMTELLFRTRKSGGWYISGVQKEWKSGPQRAYAKIGLGIITSAAHNVANCDLLEVKFRVWPDKAGNVRKTLSVE